MRRMMAGLQLRLDVYTLATLVMLVYAAGLYARPDSGISGYIGRDVGINPVALAALCLVGAGYVAGRRTPTALFWGTLPLAFYALSGVTAAIVHPDGFNMAGPVGQAGFWLMIHLSIRGQANAR